VIAGELTRDFALTAPQLAFLSSAYYLAFGLAQLPLGLALDRFGPRRVVGSLMALTAAGAAGFALAGGFTTLSISRALIGLGVSGCLMGALKAFRTWLPPNRMATATSIYVTIGGLGGLASTAPTQMLLGPLGWRGVFAIAAVLALAVSIAIFTVMPDSERGRSSERFVDLLAGFRTVFGDGRFWRVALPYIAAYAPYSALQGLWFGPWLADVDARSQSEIANLLFATVLAHFVVGGVVGPLADRLVPRGVPHARVFALGVALSLGALLALTLAPAGLRAPLMVAYSVSLTLASLAMAMLSTMYPPELAGRVNTAQNMLAFFSVFASQWAFGVVLGFFPDADGRYAAEGYRTALLVFAGLHALAMLCLLPRRATPARGNPARHG
jgi:MFS family permease